MLLPQGRGKKPRLELTDLPVFAREQLGLSGINLSTDLFVGADRARLESVRERADRASCSCLLLVEHEPQNAGVESETAATTAVTRMTKVVEAAHILGCSAASVRVVAEDNDDVLARVAQRMRVVMKRAEKLDINLLIAPHKGLTQRPERVTELLKKVGGFRIGTFPDFQTAAESADAAGYLHRLTPYATVVSASTLKFVSTKKGEAAEAAAEPLKSRHAQHQPYDIRALVKAVMSVGYDGPLAIDYRGAGDVVAGITLTRDMLRESIGEDEPEEVAEEP